MQKKAVKILTVSEYSRKDIIETYGVSNDKVKAIWNGASDLYVPLDDENKMVMQDQYANGLPYLLFVGALHPRKNVSRLIKAFEKIKIENPSLEQQLVIVGTELWSNSNYPVQMDAVIKSQIHFTGHVQLHELAKIMAAAQIFTYVPYFEGFGIPLVEAMKCGTPILSGNLTSLPEVAGEAALYCNPLDTNDIAEKLLQLINDNELQMNLTEKGLERAKQFSWDKTAESVWQEIDSTLT